MSDLPKIRPPSTFTGAMGFAVDDWLSEMEQQFAYYGDKFPNDHVKVSFAVGYLAQNALHWWQHEPDRANLDWNGFVARLHGRYRPIQAAQLARTKLNELKQRPNQSVNHFTSQFHTIMTPITDMNEADKVHYYIKGLQTWLGAKLWQQYPKTLKQAIDDAVSIEATRNFGRMASGQSSSSSSNQSHSRSSGHSSSSGQYYGSAPMDTSLNHIQHTSTSTHGNRFDDVDDFGFDHDYYGQPATTTHQSDPMQALCSKMETMVEQRLNAIFTKQQPNRSSNSNANRGPSSSSYASSMAKSGGNGNGSGGNRGGYLVPGLKHDDIEKLRSEGKCFLCKQKGHMKNDCPKRPKNE